MANHTRTYTFRILARRCGALGLRETFVASREGATEYEALVALYNEFEHVFVLGVTVQ